MISNPKLGGGVPVGTMAYWPGTAATLAAVEDDWIIANGATLNKSLYPELFKSIGYTYGGSGDNFLIPYMVDKKYVRCYSSAGTVTSASIPNIRGRYGDWVSNIVAGSLSGAIYWPGTGQQNEHCKHENGFISAGGGVQQVFAFDASRCSSVYKSSATTVTPYSMDMIPIIKVK